MGDPPVEANQQVGKQVRDSAADAMSRDLGIIASGQLPLHHWIAAFATMASYAGELDMIQVAQDMATCLDEAKQDDQAMTAVAKKIAEAGAQASGDERLSLSKRPSSCPLSGVRRAASDAARGAARRRNQIRSLTAIATRQPAVIMPCSRR